MSEAVWFFEDDGERKGPVDEAAILELSNTGKIGDDTLVWREGFEDWIAFQEAGFSRETGNSKIASHPPSLPPALRPASAFVPGAITFNHDFDFGIWKTLGQGWRLMCSDFWPFVGFFAIMYLILGVVSQLGLTMFFLMFPLMAGYSWYALLRKRGKPAAVDLLFEGFRRQFGPLALANLAIVGIATLILLIVGIACVGGCVGLVPVLDGVDAGGSSDLLAIALMVVVIAMLFFIAFVPMVLANQMGYFAMLLIMEGNLNAGEAMSLAWRATKKRWFKFVLLSLVAFVLVVAGVVALYVGVFVACAWLALGQIYIYEEAFGDPGENVAP